MPHNSKHNMRRARCTPCSVCWRVARLHSRAHEIGPASRNTSRTPAAAHQRRHSCVPGRCALTVSLSNSRAAEAAAPHGLQAATVPCNRRMHSRARCSRPCILRQLTNSKLQKVCAQRRTAQAVPLCACVVTEMPVDRRADVGLPAGYAEQPAREPHTPASPSRPIAQLHTQESRVTRRKSSSESHKHAVHQQSAQHAPATPRVQRNRTPVSPRRSPAGWSKFCFLCCITAVTHHPGHCAAACAAA
jgi:hypothetical protein